jgi:uncharacterized glyoxalase superfamily protein PhnB
VEQNLRATVVCNVADFEVIVHEELHCAPVGYSAGMKNQKPHVIHWLTEAVATGRISGLQRKNFPWHGICGKTDCRLFDERPPVPIVFDRLCRPTPNSKADCKNGQNCSLHLWIDPTSRATINVNILMTLPPPVPEVPAANVDKAAAYYVNTLGFTFDWGDDQGGIAGISKGNCRLFITNRSFREHCGNTGPIVFWLNLNSKAKVDELYEQWKAAQAKIVSEPADKPWKLREFMAADLDENLIRVFYDFRNDM